MSISAVVKNFRDGSLVVSDATTPTPITLTVQYEAGDFSLTGSNEGNSETTVYLDRGELGTLRKTNRSFPSGSFSAHFTDLRSAEKTPGRSPRGRVRSRPPCRASRVVT